MSKLRRMRGWIVPAALGALALAGIAPARPILAAPPPANNSCAPVAHLIDNGEPAGSGIAAMTAAAPDDVWAVGVAGQYDNHYAQSRGTPFIMHWAGTEWAPVPAPSLNPAGPEGGLWGLSAFGPADLWAVGTQYRGDGPDAAHPLTVHWDGQSWQQVPAQDQPGGWMGAIDGSGPTDLWAVGTAIWHSTGTDWQIVPTDVPPGVQLSLRSVAVTSPTDAWAAGTLGDTYSPDARGILLHWNGQSWATYSALPAGFEPRAVAAVHGQAGVWAVGKSAAHWDGQRWTKVAVPGLGQDPLSSVTVTAAGEAWAIRQNMGLSGPGIFRWDGRTWQPVSGYEYNNIPFTTLGQVGAVGPGDAWVGGSAATSTGSGGNWADGFIVHIFSPCAVPTAGVADPHQTGVLYFSQVRHTLRGPFRAYWDAHGGLAQFGYPITEPFAEKSATDGRTYTVQYFQRNRFELHPENAGTPYEVELGLLGRTVAASPELQQNHAFQPLATPPPGQQFFPATGHSLALEFAAYWQAHGGLAVYGYPISEPFKEWNPADSKEYLVQYFERNRLEYHPELPPAFQVSLGLLGADVLQTRGWLP